VVAYANEKNGQRFASVPVAVFFTQDFAELYRYVEYPAVYRKERVIGHLRAPRAGETDEQSKARGGPRDRHAVRVPLLRPLGPRRHLRNLSALTKRLITTPSA
jgi:hypothetical protein